MTRLAPADLSELRDHIAGMLAAEEPVELVAGGSKRGLGRPVQAAHQLDLTHLSGIRDYAPSELVLTAGAGTPLAEIERALEEAGQMLAFEPPDWRGLLGADARWCPRLQSLRSAPHQGGRGARSFSRLSGSQRPRRDLQGRRQGHQERHRL